MANVVTQETRLIISAVDRSTAVMQKAQANFQKMVKVVGVVTAAFYTAKKAWDLAEVAARQEQSMAAFQTQVEAMGRNARVEFARIRQASAGLIDQKTLVESANRAMSLGIPIDHLGKLMEISRAKARDMGITTAQAFSDIATGIGRGSPMIIDNLGITLKLGEANDAMAKSLHKTVEEMTAKEKKLAILNAVEQAGTEALQRHNLEQKTTAERMQQLVATMEDVKLFFGTILIRGMAGATAAFQGLAAAALNVFGAIRAVEYGFYKFMDMVSRKHSKATDEAKASMDASFSAAQDMAGKSIENFKAMTASSQEIMNAYKKTGKAAKKSAEEQVTAAKNLLDNAAWMKVVAIREREEQRKKTEENAAMEAYAEIYYAQQAKQQKAELDKAAHDYNIERIEQEHELWWRRHDEQIQMYQNYAEAMASITEAMYLMMGQKSRTMFEIFKTLRVAQAIVDMYAAIQQVWADPNITSTYAKIAMTAIVAAKTAANVEAIRNTKYGGGSTSFGSVSVSSTSVGGGPQPYTYYSYEQSNYGSGWRPGEGPDAQQRSGDTYIFNGDVYDRQSFEDRIVNALVKDLRNKGTSREMIQRYAMDRR